MPRSGLTLLVFPLFLLGSLVQGCSAPEPIGPVLHGSVLSGTEPLADFTVRLYEANADFTPLGQTRTREDGSFRLEYNEPSSSDTILYLLAEQSLDTGSNDLLSLATVFEYSSIPAEVVINERTTVATAYSLARFIDANNRIAPASPGLRTAVGMAHHFVDVETGGLGPVIQDPVNRETSTLPTLDSLANLISACIRDKGSACAQLFEWTQARSPNTLNALISLAHDPSFQAEQLFELSQEAPTYQPALEEAPSAWTLALRFVGALETMNGPGNLAIDSEGSIWVTNNYEFSADPLKPVCGSHQLLRFTSTGARYPGSPYEGGGLDGAGFGIGIDPKGHVWVGNFGFKGLGCKVEPVNDSVSRFGPDGEVLSPKEGIRADGKIYQPQGTVPDVHGNIWIANCGDSSVTVLWDGHPENATHITDLGIEDAFDIAHNSAGQAFVTGNKSQSVAVIDPDGTPASNSPLAGDGLFNQPMGVAVDSGDNVWVANSLNVHAPCPEGYLGQTPGGFLTLIRADGSTSTFEGGGLETPWGVALDGNDNLWVANFAEQRLSHFCGVPETGCPRGKKAGDAISPEGTGYGFNGLTRSTGAVVDASGNVWVTNNWKNDAKFQTNPGGYEIVAFIGLAEPVARPQGRN